MYFMSDEAVGTKWKRRIPLTVRHAAGADKYLYPKSRSKPTGNKRQKL